MTDPTLVTDTTAAPRTAAIVGSSIVPIVVKAA